MNMLKNNWAYFVWSVFCFFITRIIIGDYIITGIIYLISVLFMFTPMAEDLLRLAYGLRKVNDNHYYNKIAPIFAEVYLMAMRDGMRNNKRINSKILFYMENSMQINAYALGRSVVGITKGSVDFMTPDELKGLFAHELGHIVSGQTKASLFALTCNFFFSIINWACIFIINIITWIMDKTDRDISQVNKVSGRSQSYVTWNLPFLVIRLVFRIIRWVLCLLPGLFNLFIMANSRNNEYIADNYAVKLGYGQHLASALKKISRLEVTEQKGIFSELKNTHPYTLDRIARIEQALQGGHSNNYEILWL